MSGQPHPVCRNGHARIDGNFSIVKDSHNTRGFRRRCLVCERINSRRRRVEHGDEGRQKRRTYYKLRAAEINTLARTRWSRRPRCKRGHVLSENHVYYEKDKNCVSGFRRGCLLCKRLLRRQWYKKHREEHIARIKKRTKATLNPLSFTIPIEPQLPIFIEELED